MDWNFLFFTLVKIVCVIVPVLTMVAYAVLRLRGHDHSQAAALVLHYRKEAVLVPAYVYSVEQWLAAT